MRRWSLGLMLSLLLLGFVFQPVAAGGRMASFTFYSYPSMALGTLSMSLDLDGGWRILSLECDCDLHDATGVLLVTDSDFYNLLHGVMSLDWDGEKWVRELRLGGLVLLRMEKYDRDKWLLTPGGGVP